MTYIVDMYIVTKICVFSPNSVLNEYYLLCLYQFVKIIFMELLTIAVGKESHCVFLNVRIEYSVIIG